VKVKVKKVDILSDDIFGFGNYDIIVSNPPYICEEEKEKMEKNVLEHEPSLALFVPNEDPLLFYRKIGLLALQLLNNGGLLFFEINRRFGKEVVTMLQELGYEAVELRQDLFGNDRMVKAIKPQ
jgi:release factor glutamine methyltransferase